MVFAMKCLIRLQQPFKANIHQQKGLDLTLTNNILLRAVFPALRALRLRYCDSNTPCMDKLFHLSHRTTVAIENSLEHLNDESLFGSLKTVCGVATD